MSEMRDGTDENFTPWTDEGSARLLAAVAAVQEAIAAHAQALIAAAGDDEAVFEASEELMPALLAYADAQFDFTGYGFPLGVLSQLDDEDDEDIASDDDQDEQPSASISVVHRHDYLVNDVDALLASARSAYRETHADASAADAVSDVDHLGVALYELAHAHGWDNLRDVEGLEPVAGITAVIDQPELLGSDPDDWAEAVHDEHAEVLFSQADVYR